ncbi:MAG: hypothetical protein CSB23_01320 [Deltaproteobacteria bacterium]|nr:MAG: hypothetical protein CSB23_01320 [Deltaproteobacteria bacterium]
MQNLLFSVMGERISIRLNISHHSNQGQRHQKQQRLPHIVMILRREEVSLNFLGKSVCDEIATGLFGNTILKNGVK